MSAITGIGDSLTIVFRASTSLSRGTATRTRSAPASATVRICSMVASRLAVSVLHMVCTATGAPPPMGTSRTKIWRFEATGTVEARVLRGGYEAEMIARNQGATSPTGAIFSYPAPGRDDRPARHRRADRDRDQE